MLFQLFKSAITYIISKTLGLLQITFFIVYYDLQICSSAKSNAFVVLSSHSLTTQLLNMFFFFFFWDQFVSGQLNWVRSNTLKDQNIGPPNTKLAVCQRQVLLSEPYVLQRTTTFSIAVISWIKTFRLLIVIFWSY